MNQERPDAKHVYCTIKVALDSNMMEQIGYGSHFFDLVSFDNIPLNQVFYLKKKTLFTFFKQLVEERLGVPILAQRYRFWKTRHDGTSRPDRYVTSDEENMAFVDVTAEACVKLYLQVPQQSSIVLEKWVPLPQGVNTRIYKGDEDILLFFKYYDAILEQLKFVGRAMLKKNTRIKDMLPFIRGMCNIADNIDMDLYEEIRFKPKVIIEQLEFQLTLGNCCIGNGDIILVQKKEMTMCRYPTVRQFMEYKGSFLEFNSIDYTSPKT